MIAVSASVASAHNRFGHVYAVVAIFRYSPRLDVADTAGERDVLGHQLMRVEVDCTKASTPRFCFRERHQRPADAMPLVLGPPRDVVEQQASCGLFQHQNACDAPGLL